MAQRRAKFGVMLVAVVLLLPAMRAQASSIFFLRGGNIWVANPDGSAAKQVTTGGTYDFVSSAKTANVIAFHRGGNSATNEYGTLNANGSGLAVNPYASFSVDDQFFTRLDNAGDRITFAYKQHTASPYFDAGSVGTDGSNPQLIYFSVGHEMDARTVTFGDPAGDTLLFTDVGGNYQFPGPQTPCSGTDDFGDVLVLQTPGQTSAEIYCRNDVLLSDPALSPNGQVIAAAAESDLSGSSGQIVTMPLSGAVASATDQTPLTNITPANSGDSLPDFSPDGTQIVFQGPNSTVYTVPASGGTPRLILSNAAVPAWSPYTLPGGGGVTLKLSVTAKPSQRVLKNRGLLENVICNLPCALGAVGQVVIKSAHKTYRTRTVYKTLPGGRSTAISLGLSSKALTAIRKALARGRRVTAEMGAVARQGSKTITASTSFRIRH